MQASSGSGSVRRALAYLKKSRVLGVVDYFYRVEFHITPRFFSDSNYLFFFEWNIAQVVGCGVGLLLGLDAPAFFTFFDRYVALFNASLIQIC